jgi:hypothetical protein
MACCGAAGGHRAAPAQPRDTERHADAHARPGPATAVALGRRFRRLAPLAGDRSARRAKTFDRLLGEVAEDPLPVVASAIPRPVVHQGMPARFPQIGGELLGHRVEIVRGTQAASACVFAVSMRSHRTGSFLSYPAGACDSRDSRANDARPHVHRVRGTSGAVPDQARRSAQGR